MKVGRNSPCPCGSGKKYKRCCLSKKEENLKKTIQEQKNCLEEENKDIEDEKQSTDIATSVDVDKEQRFIDETWDQFEKADYEGKISIFYKLMKREGEMYEDFAAEMLDIIHQESLKTEEGTKLEEILENYQKSCPENYQASETSYLMWQIENAMLKESWEKVDNLAEKIINHTDGDLHTYADLSELLAYSGKTSLLVRLMPLLWKEIEKLPSSYRGDLLDNIAFEAAFYAIFEHLEQNPQSQDDLEKLQQEIRKYASFDPQWIYRTIELLLGKDIPNWNQDDFKLIYRSNKKKHKHNKNSEETGRRNLLFLTVDFLGYLHREKGISYTKGQLARAHLYRYILGHTVNIMQNNQRGKNRITALNAELIIETVSMQRYLEPLNKEESQYCTLAAVVQMLPYWLEFLQERKLIDDKQCRETIEKLTIIKKDVQETLKNYFQNPRLEKDLQQIWEN